MDTNDNKENPENKDVFSENTGEPKDNGLKNRDNEKSAIAIGVKSFISVVVILLLLVVATGISTFFIPQGEILDGTYVQGAVEGFPVWRWLTAPFEQLATSDGLSIIMISLFIVVLGACFNVMDKTGGIRAIIQALIKKFGNRKYLLMFLVIFIFMLLGACFGIFEESVILLPVAIMLALSLGWDTFTGMIMCLLASGFGFASAITNPFSVSIASTLAGITILDGFWMRLLIFAFFYLLVCGFAYLYVRYIEKKPTRSATYEADCIKKEKIQNDLSIVDKDAGKAFRAYVPLFAALIVVPIISVILGSYVEIFRDLSTVLIMVVFLIGTLIASLWVTKDFKRVLKLFSKGALSVLPGVVMILLSGSIKYIMVASQIQGTILNAISSAMSGFSPFAAALILFAFVLLFNFFVSSATAKAILIIPLIMPVCATVGLSPAVAIICFVMADGYSNLLYPTNPILLLGLSVSEISYPRWLKNTVLLQAVTLAACCGFILLSTAVL